VTLAGAEPRSGVIDQGVSTYRIVTRCGTMSMLS
jgi:hypothetical protein